MSQKPLVIEKRYNAPVATVWRAITDNREMKQWYFDIPEFVAEPGFSFEFLAGKAGQQYLHQCRVTEVIPGRKIAYTWKYRDYPGDSEVCFELFPEGEQTLLRLTHRGLETFPTGEADFARESFTAGWNFILGEGLQKFLEKA